MATRARPCMRASAWVRRRRARLSSKALVRVAFDGTRAREAARYDFGQRLREVEQGPDGSIWLLEDGTAGRLLQLTPAGGG